MAKNHSTIGMGARAAALGGAILAGSLLGGCGAGEPPPAATATAPTKKGPANDPAVEALRNAIPGGQTLLPDEPAFQSAEGWGPPDYDPQRETRITAWTMGDRQWVEWAGPSTPGDYEFKAFYWRAHEFPEKDLKVPYLLPGAKEWSEAVAAPNAQFVIQGRVHVGTPYEKLRFETKIPGWVPAEKIPGSTDTRKIGILFLRIDLAPVKGEEGTGEGEREEKVVPDQKDV